ncbi:hypothetical protein [Aeromonas sp. FDAARGOS 1408]|uniref:hypothetical protein n=1 Tax=Aeromonas TaxID=642 RepID=UPI001C223BE0|nr:hypothetical protein [Aeromonas sp. FDAARGOS 1408]QXC09078.1 hypothetical protein I6L38_03775 [Aeromonas sp. FDAARGOS 1408]
MDKKLESMLTKIKEKYKFNQSEQDEYVTRNLDGYESLPIHTHAVQNTHAFLVLQEMQELILKGYRFVGTAPHSCYFGVANNQVTLMLPDNVIQENMEQKRQELISEFEQQRLAAIDKEVQILMASAAEEAEAKAAAALKKEQDEMANRLKSFLLS